MSCVAEAVLPETSSARSTSRAARHDDPVRVAVDLRGTLADVLAGHSDLFRVREEIGASWQRSAAAGLKPDGVKVPFDPAVGGNGVLIRAARPVLDQLAVDLDGAPVSVLLANELGQVIDRRVADGFLSAQLERILLAPGFVYAEHLVGTNGIGTALAQRRPVIVEGEEHFAEAFTGFACAGAPISDPRSGRILGVVDLTTMVADSSALMLPLATRAAREIEQRLVDDAGMSERLMLHRFLQQRRQAKGPLVFITPSTMIANAAADGLLVAADEPLLREWATGPARRRGDTSRVVLTSGTAVSVRWEPILEGGSRVGAMLRLKTIADVELARPQSRDRHPTFGWDSLSATERSVTELVAQGHTNREAAERLFLSHHTVGFHLRSIFGKLGVSSRVELTRLVIEHGTERHPTDADLVPLAATS